MFTKMRKSKKGFTLIELIVVIAILGILALIAIPRLGGFTESARIAADKEAAAVVANAGAMYYATNPTITSITIANLTGAALVVDKDIALKSKAYSTTTKKSIETNDIKLEDGVVTVTLKGQDGAPDYEISK